MILLQPFISLCAISLIMNSHLSSKNYSFQLRVSRHFRNISYSFIRYIGDIFLVLHLSLCTFVSKFPIETMLTKISHSNYNDLHTFLSPTLVSYSILGLETSFLSLVLSIIISEYLYTWLLLFDICSSWPSPSLSNQMYRNPILYNSCLRLNAQLSHLKFPTCHS